MGSKKWNVGAASAVIAATVAFVSVSFLPKARADRFEGHSVTRSILRQGKNLTGSDSIDVDITAQIDRIVERVTLVSQPVTDVVCTTEPGEGRGDWHGFFTAREEDKAAALDAAIKGIGPKTARLIVRDGLLHSKPRSWQAFRDVINEAQRRYGGNIAYQVLVQYGSENARGLGYYSEESCQEQVTYQLVPQTIEDRIPATQVTRHFRIELVGGALLPTESETLNLTFDGIEDSLSVSSGYNRYDRIRLDSASGDRVVYRLSGARLAVTPENTLSAVASRSADGELILMVNDTLFPSTDRDAVAARGDTRLVIQVYLSRRMWFDKKLAEMEVSLGSPGQMRVRTGFRPAPGDEVYVNYRIQRLGSPYFSQDASSSRETNHVR